MSNRGRGYGRALLQIHAHNENILAQEAIEEATKAREDEKWYKDLWSLLVKALDISLEAPQVHLYLEKHYLRFMITMMMKVNLYLILILNLINTNMASKWKL